ncbi:MAG: PQQ-binding-like beta-propeller repeat protein [Sphingomonas sp.]
MPMIMMSRWVAIVLAGASLIAADEPSGQDELAGWWRATVSHAGESDDIYLHFQTRGSKQFVSFSIPSVATDDQPLSLYSVSPGEVNLKSAGWILKRGADGSLRGTLPRGLVPAHDFPAVFRRSAEPRLLSPAQPTQPAPKPLWSQSLGAPVFGGIAYDPVTKAILVGTTAGELTALDPLTGKRRWSTRLSAPIRSAPVIAGGAILVATDEAAAKLDKRTGRLLWTVPIGKPLKPAIALTDLSNAESRWDEYSAAPVVRAGLVYVGSRDGCVHALSQGNGSKVRDYCNDDEITGSPVIERDRIYYPSFDGKVYAARLSDGKILWKRDTLGAVPRDLTLSGNNLLASSRSYDLVALDKRNGALAWQRHVWWSWVDSVAEPHPRDILIGSSDAQRIYDLGAATGRPIWATFVGGWAWPKPTRAGNTVYAGVIGTAQPYVGKRRGGLAALDARTGRLKWLFQTPHADKVAAYGFAAAPLVVGGRLYAADLNGSVFAFRAE